MPHRFSREWRELSVDAEVSTARRRRAGHPRKETDLRCKDASNAYGGATRALAKLAADDAKGFEKRLAAFAQSLAKLAAEHDLDAQHRAQVRAAFHDLAATINRTVSDEQVAAWLHGVGFV